MARKVESADFAELYEMFAKQAVSSFNASGSVSHQTFMLTLGDKPGHVIAFGALDSSFQKLFYADNAGKDMLAEFIQQALTHGSPVRKLLHDRGLPLADVIVQISEAWMKKALKTDDHNADKRKYGPSLEHHPGRGEVILVGVHALGESQMGFCPIEDNPRRAEYAPLFNDGHITGRFSMNDGEKE